jgi:glycerol-3-phosphate dehydrogenase (NAD(P)+)
MRVLVVGGGAWGTALASSMALRHEVQLVFRLREQAEQVNAERVNARYLPGVTLAAGLMAVDAVSARATLKAGGVDLVVVATPMSGLRESLSLAAGIDIVWLCKGFEQSSGLLGHEVAAQVLGEAQSKRHTAVLSGPSFALEVARGQPTAVVVASANNDLSARVADAVRSDALRAYTSDDPVGVEVGGAMKNVMALAAGLCDGLGDPKGNAPDELTHEVTSHTAMALPGTNARAALVTRGLAEMTRLGEALGASPLTFMGLSGLGDLVLTATGALSRNRQVGLALAGGQSLPQVLAALGHVAEGVHTAPVALARAHALGVAMPITEAVVAVLQGRCHPREAAAALMARGPKAEG